MLNSNKDVTYQILVICYLFYTFICNSLFSHEYINWKNKNKTASIHVLIFCISKNQQKSNDMQVL